MVITNVVVALALAIMLACFAYAMFELRSARGELNHLRREQGRVASDAWQAGFNAGYSAAGEREEVGLAERFQTERD